MCRCSVVFQGRLPRWIKWRACDAGEARKCWRMSYDVDKATEKLENELWRRWSDGKVGEWAELIAIVTAELIPQLFRHFIYVTAHSPSIPSLYLRHSSFSNPSLASPTSQLVLMSRAHSPTFPSLHLSYNSFSIPSIALPTSQLIFQRLRCFTYVTADSPTLPSLYHVTAHSPTLLSLLLRHLLFIYVTWRAAHGLQKQDFKTLTGLLCYFSENSRNRSNTHKIVGLF